MRFEFKVVIGFIVALSLVILLGFYSYDNNKKQLAASLMVNHTNKVLYHSEQLRSTVIELETAQHGYCLTGKTDFLLLYTIEENRVISQLKNLQQLTKDNPQQRQRLTQLESLIQQKILFTTQIIELKKTNEQRSLEMIGSLKDKQLMDHIQQTFTAFVNDEKMLLQQRILDREKQTTHVYIFFILTLFITALILVLLFYAIYVNLHARKKTEQELQRTIKDVKDLYDNAPCGYHSIGSNGLFVDINHTMLDWLGYNKEEVIGKKKIQDVLAPESIDNFQLHFPVFLKQGFIHNLEFSFLRKNGTTFPGIISSTAVVDEQGNYVKSRTTTFDYTELKQANDKINILNQELEAFSYTVSHDLRSPLRSIAGYAQILEEDFAPQLGEEGKRVTGIIINNTKRMGTLIDDLLRFSQLGRKELSMNYIDNHVLVQQVLHELTEDIPAPSLQINLQQLSPCYGDFNMIRQVWINLLSNALKYSQKKEIARIEIGSQSIGEEIVYYVKDNGAGFDMQYVHKLFAVFQRLHRVNEFEGTGVGLAIVKRIVSRHHGRVWAESTLHEGSTFYFSIPTKLIST